MIPKLFTSPVPLPDEATHWVETIPGGAKIQMQVYSPSIWGVWTHFAGRTKPCYEDHSFCAGGHEEGNMRWYGYVFGWHLQQNKRTFLQLTARACRQWYEQIADGVSLRGMHIEVSRTLKKQGPLTLRVNKFMSADLQKLPQDVDPKLSLYKLWGIVHKGRAASLSLVSNPRDIPEDDSDPQVP